MYVCMSVMGLRFCARAFSSCGKWGPLFIAVHGPLTIAASLVAEHRLQSRRNNLLDINGLDDNKVLGRHVFTNIFLTCRYCLVWR